MKKNAHTLQQVAEFLRDAAYSDRQSHFMEWTLRVIHPNTNDGVVGFSGGLWNKDRSMVRPCDHEKYDKRVTRIVSVSFSYDEVNGITNFQLWADRVRSVFPFGSKPSFDDFKKIVVEQFGIDKLYWNGIEWMTLEEYNARQNG